MARSRQKTSIGAALVALTVAATSVAGPAQAVTPDQTMTVSIAQQRLSDALRQFAEAAGLQLVYDTKITDGKTSPNVFGAMTSNAALDKLLAGSGLNFRFSDDRTVVITAAAASDGTRAVGVVSVEGVTGHMPYGDMVSATNGVNGSRDVEATEGTSSYTTGATSIVSKIPQTLRDTPQSVSVVTSQQIKDQNLISLKDILAVAPGVTATPGPNTAQFSVYSRGFEVNTYSFDGGAPISYASGNRPVLNMSEFDSLQLIRGANGLFGGYGDPGGTVNLIRKKPLDHQQIVYSQDVGSWHRFREEIDGTRPLTDDGSLRGRAVVSREDNKYFYDVASSQKTSVYGILEYDLTPKTLVTLGSSYNRERTIPNQGGLPRYLDGSEIDFPTSTCLCLPSVYDHASKTEYFSTVSHQINDDLLAKVNVSYTNQQEDTLYYGVTGQVYKGGPATGAFGGFRSISPYKDTALDYTLTGKFDLLDRHHVFVIGGNYRYLNADGAATSFLPNIQIPNLFAFDPTQYELPALPSTPDYFAVKSRQRDTGYYANVRLELLKSLHVQTGIRYSSYTQSSLARVSYSPDDQISPPLKDKSHSSPNVGVTYDFLDHYTLYGSHEKVFLPQLNTRQTVGSTPPPVVGKNDEVGVKWQSADSKLNAAIAYFDITKKGFLQTDYSNPTQNIAYLNNSVSRGVEFELAGELLPGWQVSGNYTFNQNTTTTDYSNAPASSFTPKKRLKTFTTYRGQSGTFLDGFTVGGGIDYQSSAYNTGYICTVISSDPSVQCPGFASYQFTSRGYTTVSLVGGYKLAKNVDLTVVAKNITNVKAYSATPFQNQVGYNFYIDPANVVATLRVNW